MQRCSGPGTSNDRPDGRFRRPFKSSRLSKQDYQHVKQLSVPEISFKFLDSGLHYSEYGLEPAQMWSHNRDPNLVTCCAGWSVLSHISVVGGGSVCEDEYGSVVWDEDRRTWLKPALIPRWKRMEGKQTETNKDETRYKLKTSGLQRAAHSKQTHKKLVLEDDFHPFHLLEYLNVRCVHLRL